MNTNNRVKKDWSIILFSLVVSVLFSCSSSKITTKKNKNVVKLHTLWVDTSTFNKWASYKEKMMFRFTFAKRQITLTGWFYRPATDDYDSIPTDPMNISDQTYRFRTNPLYLGNFKLHDSDIVVIDQLAQASATGRYILFVPVESKNYHNNLKYDIYISPDKTLTPEDMKVGAVRSFIVTNKAGDPSPPAKP